MLRKILIAGTMITALFCMTAMFVGASPALLDNTDDTEPIEVDPGIAEDITTGGEYDAVGRDGDDGGNSIIGEDTSIGTADQADLPNSVLPAASDGAGETAAQSAGPAASANPSTGVPMFGLAVAMTAAIAAVGAAAAQNRRR
jgi:hypothetical protein